MGATYRPTPRAHLAGLTASLLLFAAVSGASVLSVTNFEDDRLLGGYTSLEERITEYLFDGEESQPMWA